MLFSAASHDALYTEEDIAVPGCVSETQISFATIILEVPRDRAKARKGAFA